MFSPWEWEPLLFFITCPIVFWKQIKYFTDPQVERNFGPSPPPAAFLRQVWAPTDGLPNRWNLLPAPCPAPAELWAQLHGPAY